MSQQQDDENIEKSLLENEDPVPIESSHESPIPQEPPQEVNIPTFQPPQPPTLIFDPRISTSKTPKKSFENNDEGIARLRKSSRKIAVPPAKAEDEELKSFHDVYINNMLNRSVNGEGTINSSIILLILMVIRFSPELLTGDKIFDLYGEDIQLYTNWENLQFIIAFPYWPAAMIGYLVCLFVGLIALFVVLPGVPMVKRLAEEGASRSYVMTMKFIWHFSHPMYMMTVFIILLTVSHGIFILGVMTRIKVLAIIGRALYGFSDSMHLCFHTFFIVNRFGHSRFALAFGFLTSVKTMTFMIESNLPRIQSMQGYFITGLVMCIVSVAATLSLPNADMETKSIFRLEDRDEDWGDVDPTLKPLTRTIGQQVIDLLSFGVIHQSLNFVVFLLYMFPFYYGGTLWNSRYNNDINDIKFLHDCVYFSRGIFSPAIGALLDAEKHKVEPSSKTGWKWIVDIAKKTKIHLITMVSGLIGIIACQYAFHSGNIPGKSPYFYLVSFTLGLSFATTQNTMLTLPWMFFSSTRNKNSELCYATYKSLTYFMYSAACVINIYVIKSEDILIPIWYACTSYLGILAFIACAAVAGTYIWKKFLRPATTEDNDHAFKPVDPTKEVQIVEELYAHRVKKVSKWWLLYYVPLEVVVLGFFLTIFFVGSGIASIILTFQYKSDHDPVRM